jgi:hypothetical protein
VDVNRRGLAIIGAVFVTLFVLQGVIILSRSAASDVVSHIRVHRLASSPCVVNCTADTSPGQLYRVTFFVNEPGDASRPICTLTVKTAGKAVGYRVLMEPTGRRTSGSWHGSAGVEGSSGGLLARDVTIGCR